MKRPTEETGFNHQLTGLNNPLKKKKKKKEKEKTVAWCLTGGACDLDEQASKSVITNKGIAAQKQDLA